MEKWEKKLFDIPVYSEQDVPVIIKRAITGPQVKIINDSEGKNNTKTNQLKSNFVIPNFSITFPSK